MKQISLPLLVAALFATPIAAQSLPKAQYPGWSGPAGFPPAVLERQMAAAVRYADLPADPVMLGMAGALGAAAGVLGGGYAGYEVDRAGGRCREDCGGFGMLFGAAIGSALLTPVAVHIANGGRGDFGNTLFTSGVITGAGFVLGLMTNSREVLIPLPVAAIIGSVAAERSATPASE